MKLTEKIITDFAPPATGRRIISDQHRDAPRGFALRVNAGGRRLFVLRYRAEGKDRLLTIGEHPTWSLAAARKKATEFRRGIDAGRDILAERRTERGEPTVKEAVAAYCASQADKLKSGAAIRSILDRYLVAEHGRQKLRDLRRRDIIALVERVGQDHGRTAALLLTYIKQLLQWAEDREIIELSPAATLKPQKIGKSLAPKSRARVLDDEEITTLWTRAESSGVHRMTALALKLILLTGQRPGEVAGMEWDEIKGDIWIIPAARRGKTESEQSVPLTPSALEILESAKDEAERLAKRRRVQPSGFVFEARPGRHLSTAAMARAVNRYADELGNQNNPDRWTPHDLRRTCRTGLAAAGVSEIVSEAVIGHTRKGIVGVYDRHRYDDEKRQALSAWERRLLRIVNGEPGDNVVTIRGAK